MADPKIKVTADTSQAQRQIDDLGKSLADIEKTSIGATRALAAITAGAAAMGYAISQTLNSAGLLIDAAGLLGISVQSLQTFQAAAGQAGVGAEEFNSALMKMNVNIGEALIKGTGPASAAINRLGLDLSTIAGMKPDKQFEAITKRLLEIPDPATRAATAVELFGKQGPKVLKVAEALDEVRKRMESMGALLTDEEIAALDLAGDKVDELANIFNTALQKAVADMAPYIIAIADNITKAIEKAGGLDAILGKIGATIRFAMNVALIMGMVKAIGLMIVGIKNAQTAFIIFNSIVKRSPLFLLVGAAAALATYFGVDIVGGLDKMLGLSEGVADANTQIANKAAEIKKENEGTAVAVQKVNEAQQKVLDALDQTIAKKQVEVGYLQNVIALGEEEASIRKVMGEEERKLMEAKISLNSKEAQTRLQSLNASLRQEASLKNQITNQNELNKAILGMMVGLTSAGKEQEKLDTLMELQRGKTLKQIEDAKLKQIEGDKFYQKMAINIQRTAIQDAISQEINKFDKFKQLAQEYDIQQRKFTELELIINKQNNDIKQQLLIDLNAARLTAEKEYNQQKIELEKQTQEKLLQLEIDRITRSLQANKTMMAEQLSQGDQAILQKAGENERQKKILSERIEFEKKSELEKTQFGIEAGAQLFSALGKENKKAFEAAKAFNIANAIMNTYMAATKALATYPFPFGAIAAAAAVAMGMAQVAQIRGQTYSGREKGGPIAAGMPYMVGEAGPEIIRAPSGGGMVIPNGEMGGGGGVNVTFNIMANDTTGFDDLLMSRRGLIRSVISDAMLESGRRG